MGHRYSSSARARRPRRRHEGAASGRRRGEGHERGALAARRGVAVRRLRARGGERVAQRADALRVLGLHRRDPLLLLLDLHVAVAHAHDELLRQLVHADHLVLLRRERAVEHGEALDRRLQEELRARERVAAGDVVGGGGGGRLADHGCSDGSLRSLL